MRHKYFTKIPCLRSVPFRNIGRQSKTGTIHFKGEKGPRSTAFGVGGGGDVFRGGKYFASSRC